jgi:hypothetical protein
MDKQAESEKEFYLWTVLPIQRTQSIAKAKDISLNIYPITVYREHYRRAVCGKTASTVL